MPQKKKKPQEKVETLEQKISRRLKNVAKLAKEYTKTHLTNPGQVDDPGVARLAERNKKMKQMLDKL